MRVIGACSNCKKRKERCDPGIPCKSCLEHYKGDLVQNPCRDRLLSDLSDAFLSDRLGWHPTARPLESFFSASQPEFYTHSSYMIPLKLGFGSSLYLPVHALQVDDTDTLLHDHVVYAWPPTSSTGEQHTHAVLPAILTPEAEASLHDTLHGHLSLLVTHHFRSFPLYCSQLRILREVYIFYRSLPSNSLHSRLLHQALKLLVLVHIGGDLALPHPSTDPILTNLVQATMSHLPNDETITPTPCFIRAQFGAIMPSLALSLMKDVLSSLEQLFLNRECHEWPLALAVSIVVLLTIESVHYHAAKLPYHASFDTHKRTRSDEELCRSDNTGVTTLLRFYAACFSGCHARLKPDWEGEVAQTSIYDTTSTSFGTGTIDPATGLKAEDKFVESVREAVRKASPGGYLVRKASGEREGESMEWFFDRLVARLLVLKV
ncbi:hypothetical protein BDV96DRAFT_580767 [Lophiotrema nucula]|uniref:Zn(2)-C6 fungal-type domain-containing protein n=1 Tax=Lophiotrema nucula TaxID=690887 RepID=A0A6A5Z0S2_9PLEO|nr:hypothetical protein BDV96DRAFT_580767 [Lophiotrema nucula]